MQKKEYLEQKKVLPWEFTKNVDLVYNDPFEAFQAIKKLLGSKESSAVEQRVLVEINEIGKFAQEQRPDNANLRRTSEPAKKQVELQGRCKWLSGTLHLMIRKIYEDKETNEQQKFEAIQTAVEECLKRLKTVLEQLDLWSSQDQDRISSSNFGDLTPKVHDLVFAERLRTAKSNSSSCACSRAVRGLCLDWNRLKPALFDETTVKKMKEAETLKTLEDLIQKELEKQLQAIFAHQNRTVG